MSAMTNHPNRSKRAIRLYADYHTPTIVYALYDGAWYILPATSTGWADKHQWSPGEVILGKIATKANEITHLHAWQAKMAYGIPQDVWSAA